MEYSGEGIRRIRALPGEEMEDFVFEAAERGFSKMGHLWRSQSGGDFGDKVREGFVGDGVDSHPREFLLEFRVPVVLHVVVCSPWKLGRYHRPSGIIDVTSKLFAHLERVRELIYLFPRTAWSLTIVCSSSSENSPCLRSGRR